MAGKSRGELAGGTVRERPEDDGGPGKKRAAGPGGKRNAQQMGKKSPGAGGVRHRQRDANAKETWGKTATKGKKIRGSVKPKVGFGMFSRCFRRREGAR